MPIAPVALAIGAAGALGAGASIYSANKAASTISSANQQAALTQQNNLQNIAGLEQPYLSAGATDLAALQSQLPALSAPFSMTQANLEGTPGYQFSLGQGEKAIQNQMAGRGLGGVTSGPAAKGLMDYATGLASNTYMNQFNIDQANKQNTYNRLLGGAQIGQTATGQFAGAATNTANNVSQLQANTGVGQAAASNAIGAAVNNAGNSISGGLVTNALLNAAAQNSKDGGAYGSPTWADMIGSGSANPNAGS
jgi:hypothetical protein